jgi:hypothetical protein
MNATTELTIAQKLKQTDWVGAFLFIGSFTSFLVGLSFGGVQHPWTSAATLAPLIVGVAGIGAFLGWQVYRKPHSLLPMSIFYNWSAIAAFYNAMINGLVVSATPSFHVAERAGVNSIVVANRVSVYMQRMQRQALTASYFLRTGTCPWLFCNMKAHHLNGSLLTHHSSSRLSTTFPFSSCLFAGNRQPQQVSTFSLLCVSLSQALLLSPP